jgi:non-homologous end joining protein Ku
VKAKDIVKGFEVEKDEYVVLDPEELDEIKLGEPAHDRPGAVRRP